jgi:serpin B
MKSMWISAGAAVIIFLGCANDNSLPDNGTTSPDAPFTIAKSSTARDTAPADGNLISLQVSSINTFAVDIYKKISTENGNLFFSPYSLFAALGMTELGAGGETAIQIRKALSVISGGEDYHAALNGLDILLTGYAGSTEGIILNSINSTWAQSGWHFNDTYLDQLGRYYGSGVNLLDFFNHSEPSRVTINTWVADQTNNRIQDLIPQGGILPETRLVLTNAIYFLADWLFPFDAALTKNDSFFKLDNTTIQAPLMQLGATGEAVRMRYMRSGTIRAIDFPYTGDRLCMTVLLPDKGSFTAFESGISVESINATIAALDSVTLPPVRLPRFTFTTGSVSMVEPLKALGMVDAFVEGKADFSGIDGTRELFLDDVIHKAFVSVDEKGTEAAAATAVLFVDEGYDPDPPQFIADRPFIFLIRDRQTGVVLFMGRVVDPVN